MPDRILTFSCVTSKYDAVYSLRHKDGDVIVKQGYLDLPCESNYQVEQLVNILNRFEGYSQHEEELQKVFHLIQPTKKETMD